MEADRAVPTEGQGLWESGPLGAVSGSRDCCGSAEVKAHWGQGWESSAPPELLRLQLSHLSIEKLNVIVTFSASEVKGVGSGVP